MRVVGCGGTEGRGARAFVASARRGRPPSHGSRCPGGPGGPGPCLFASATARAILSVAAARAVDGGPSPPTRTCARGESSGAEKRGDCLACSSLSPEKLGRRRYAASWGMRRRRCREQMARAGWPARSRPYLLEMLALDPGQVAMSMSATRRGKWNQGLDSSGGNNDPGHATPLHEKPSGKGYHTCLFSRNPKIHSLTAENPNGIFL